MRWKGRKQSENVEDRRRGPSGKQIAVGGGFGTIAIVLLAYFLGGDPGAILQQIQQGTQNQTRQGQEYVPSKQEEALKTFVSVVLNETEDVWNEQFRKMGKNYREPKLVLFNGRVQSACGISGSATGPFYCPGDHKIYIDLLFLADMQQRLGAKGDFAIAYIVAHEVGHHVQNLLGIMDQMNDIRRRTGRRGYNKYMIKLELQADFLAGFWAHHAQRMHNILEKGDVEEAINAAGSVGDDRIQKQSQGYVVPDAFTHGTSEQRKRWLIKGMRTGDLSEGDTFNASRL